MTWMTLKESAAYAKRSPRMLAREIKAGRLRAARVGGRREYVTCPEWIDQWLEELARPVQVSVRPTTFAR